jgi:hypothetical protein
MSRILVILNTNNNLTEQKKKIVAFFFYFNIKPRLISELTFSPRKFQKHSRKARKNIYIHIIHSIASFIKHEQSSPPTGLLPFVGSSFGQEAFTGRKSESVGSNQWRFREQYATKYSFST